MWSFEQFLNEASKMLSSICASNLKSQTARSVGTKVKTQIKSKKVPAQKKNKRLQGKNKFLSFKRMFLRQRPKRQY